MVVNNINIIKRNNKNNIISNNSNIKNSMINNNSNDPSNEYLRIKYSYKEGHEPYSKGTHLYSSNNLIINELNNTKMHSKTMYLFGYSLRYSNIYSLAIFNISMQSLVNSVARKIISSSNDTQNTQPTQTTQTFSKQSITSTSFRLSLLFSNIGLLFATFLLLCCSFEVADGLKIVSVVVPHHQKSGEPVQLECNYDLEGDVLYSVKWYRGMNEFFRYVPAEKNQMQVFDVKGIIVDTALSDARRVTLRTVSRETSGKFQCEVSTDYPSFHTVSIASEMLVVYFSNAVPNITGSRTRYHVGDEVHVNCTSAKSRPAASLMWYTNDVQARSEELVDYAPVQDEDGLETSRLGLKFVVGAKHFPNGVLKIRCTATVADKYWKSAEEAVEGQLPQTSPALESKGVYTGGCSPNGFSSINYYVLLVLHQLSQILLMFSR